MAFSRMLAAFVTVATAAGEMSSGAADELALVQQKMTWESVNNATSEFSEKVVVGHMRGKRDQMCSTRSQQRQNGMGCMFVKAWCNHDPEMWAAVGGGCDIDAPGMTLKDVTSRHLTYIRSSVPFTDPHTKTHGWVCQVCSHDLTGRPAQVGGKAYVTCCR
mmetsp:Transcript_105908/g.309783  ORF Transcript_105908/g.309783 Transcript_105908/m.309783 type:complete len:161 (+) Transcript_105908:110-592(+)